MAARAETTDAADIGAPNAADIGAPDGADTGAEGSTVTGSDATATGADASPDTRIGSAAAGSTHPATTAIALPPLVALDGGEFLMGTDSADGFAEDGEGPARRVRVDPFRISACAVTNAEFREFVRATRYVTDAERCRSSFVFFLQIDEQARRAVRRVPFRLPWWLPVEDACWQRPEGPGSTIGQRLDHPVVHVSWNDAAAYCAWSGLRLPTEAEWEFAARGGLQGRRYPWGDELEGDGEGRCNIWRGRFPLEPAAPWQPGSMPARCFAPNGFGLYNASGNVWEWCQDWFSPTYHHDTSAHNPRVATVTGRRSMRGGSFLCHASYCNRYRVAGRSSNSPASASSNCGFRVAAHAAGR
jgi:formylglycine-generating enzyme required for sulfatase activity